MTQTPESAKFVESIKSSTAPKWLNLKELIAYLNEALPEAQLWGVIQVGATGAVTPVNITVTGFTEVIKNAEIVDLELTCFSIQRDGTQTESFKMNAGIMLPKPFKAADVTRINYQSFAPFSRIFKTADDRDTYYEELGWLSGMLDELSASDHSRMMNKFLRYMGGGRPPA